MNIAVIIPAYNEAEAISLVLNDIPKNLVQTVIVVNNNSTDETANVARMAKAIVVDQPMQGYGNACLKGIEYVTQHNLKPDIIVFMDADYSDYPDEIHALISPIINDDYDMVIGSRVLGKRDSGSLTPQQIVGNALATKLILWLFKFKYTDLGPFRAIKYESLLQLNMQDTTYGFTVEMQIKAVKNKFKITEVPVNYKVRIGVSKISGTLKGTIGAAYKILSTIFKYAIL